MQPWLVVGKKNINNSSVSKVKCNTLSLAQKDMAPKKYTM